MSTRSERAQRRAKKLRNQRIALIVFGLLILSALGYFAWTALVPETTPAGQTGTDTMTTTASGLQYQDVTVGTGAEATAGSTVTVHYTGWLMDGTEFDSSLGRGQPYAFTLGAREVIPGWDEGVAGMKVGGKRILVVPPDLAYGAAGAGSVIPPNAILRFEVDLLGVE